MHIYYNETSIIYSDLYPTVPQEPQTYRIKNLTELTDTWLMKLKLVKGRKRR